MTKLWRACYPSHDDRDVITLWYETEKEARYRVAKAMHERGITKKDATEDDQPYRVDEIELPFDVPKDGMDNLRAWLYTHAFACPMDLWGCDNKCDNNVSVEEDLK